MCACVYRSAIGVCVCVCVSECNRCVCACVYRSAIGVCACVYRSAIGVCACVYRGAIARPDVNNVNNVNDVSNVNDVNDVNYVTMTSALYTYCVTIVTRVTDYAYGHIRQSTKILLGKLYADISQRRHDDDIKQHVLCIVAYHVTSGHDMLPALVCNAADANAMEKWKRIIADTHTTMRNRLQRMRFPYLATMRQNDARHRVNSLIAEYHKTVIV